MGSNVTLLLLCKSKKCYTKDQKSQKYTDPVFHSSVFMVAEQGVYVAN